VKTPAPFASSDIVRLEDFTAAQIDRAAQTPGSYSSALVFSTKEEPPALPFHLDSASMEAEYFGLHHDLSAEAIARKLNGDLVWQGQDGLQWAAVLRFRRAFEAKVTTSEPNGDAFR